jgi:Pyridoxal-dependent decarboxylase, C-terminal sheet domain
MACIISDCTLPCPDHTSQLEHRVGLCFSLSLLLSISPFSCLYNSSPCRYGAQHPIVVLKEKASNATGKFVVVGHCCESGDLFSCAPGEPEVIAERLLATPTVCETLSIRGSLLLTAQFRCDSLLSRGAYLKTLSALSYPVFNAV